MSDNGFSQIFIYFIGTIEHLVCPKLCSKKFENQLTNKKFWSKTVLNRDFSVEKSHVREVNIFPQKNKNSRYLIMIAQNHHKVTQMT